MKKYNKILVVFFGLVAFLSISASAHAMTPTLTLSALSNIVAGDQVSVSVYGDPNSSIILNYNINSGVPQSRNLGNTSSSGYFSTTISTSSYGVTSGSQAYVIVNGQQSAYVMWPTSYYGGGTGSTLSVSQSSVTVAVGQSATINVYNNSNTNGGLYISNVGNVNSNIAQATVNGTNVVVYGVSVGSTTFSICSYNSSSCTPIYITVSGTNNYGYNNNYNGYNNNNYYGVPVTLIQKNFSQVYVPIGQSVTLGTSTGVGNIYVSSNSNQSVAQVAGAGYLGGNGTWPMGCSSTLGYSTLTGQPCSSVYNYGNNYNSNGSLPIGCSSTYGFSTYNGQPCSTIGSTYPNYYNTGLSDITVLGLKVGSSVLSVCGSGSANSCATVQVTVFNPLAKYVNQYIYRK